MKSEFTERSKKKFYIYVYTHCKHGYVYIGKTHDLEQRINSHDSNTNDNISREHEQLLKECAVFYFELNSSLQMDYVEKFLIDYHKPILNIQYNKQKECILEMALPKWKRYTREYEPNIYGSVFDPQKHTFTYSKILEKKIKELEDVSRELKEKNEKLKKELEQQIDLNEILKRKMKTYGGNNEN